MGLWDFVCTLLAFRRFQAGQRGPQDGSKTRLRQSKTDPRRHTAPPRLSRWLQGASQTAQDGPKIDKNPWKIDVKSHPHIGFIFVQFLIDFQSIFRPQKFDFLLELYRFYSSFGLSGFIQIKWILQCIFEPTWFGF